jgi:hypothetical protein
MTSSNETNSAAPNLNTAPVGSDSNSGAAASENKSEATSSAPNGEQGEQGERRPRRFGKHPFKNRKPRGDRPPRQEGGERKPHTPGEQKSKTHNLIPLKVMPYLLRLYRVNLMRPSMRLKPKSPVQI